MLSSSYVLFPKIFLQKIPSNRNFFLFSERLKKVRIFFKMRKIVYRYSPKVETGNTYLTDNHPGDSSIPQQQQQQNPGDSLPTGGFFSPCSYHASVDFILKPQEKIIIVFRDSDEDFSSDHPALIRDIRPGWPQVINSVSEPSYLAIVVHNTRKNTHFCVHKGARLHRLLRAPMIQSNLILLSARQLKENKFEILVPETAKNSSLTSPFLPVSMRKEG